MNQESRVTLTDSELAAFGQKLDAWASTLPDAERVFFQQILADAADAANDNASGFANLGSLMSDDLGGFAQLSGVSGSVVAYAQGISNANNDLIGNVFDSDAE